MLLLPPNSFQDYSLLTACCHCFSSGLHHCFPELLISSSLLLIFPLSLNLPSGLYTLDNLVFWDTNPPTSLKPFIGSLRPQDNSRIVHALPCLSRLLCPPPPCPSVLLFSIPLYLRFLPCIPFFVLAQDYLFCDIFPGSFSSRIRTLSPLHPYCL